ncbi:hypothetical protein Tco_1556252 [Tanacetum coccineum]
MASFPCLEGLAVAANSRSLFDRMMLYFERETSIDFDFAADLHNLWVQFIDYTNNRKLFISKLDGLPPSMMSYNCSAQNSNNLTDAMSVYIERKINDDLYFAAGLSHL